MTELRAQMCSLLLASVRDPDNRDVYLEAWMMMYDARYVNELRGEG